MKLVVGCPVANRAWVLPRWFAGIQAARGALSVELRCITTPSTDKTIDHLESMGASAIEADAGTRPPDRMLSHRWSPDEFQYMADLRNELAADVWASGADWFFSLDSDIVAKAHSFPYLLARAERDGADLIAPMVDLGRHAQCKWNFMGLRKDSTAEYKGWRAYRTGDQALEIPVMHPDMVAAAMLIHRSMKDVQWATHPQGEDVGYAINARSAGFVTPLLATDVYYQHLMFEGGGFDVT